MNGAGPDWDSFISNQLERFEAQSRLRVLSHVQRTGPAQVYRQGRRLIDFSSNDYLGLSMHPQVLEASRRAVGDGAGATASRLLSGESHRYHELECRLARFKQTEAALVFPTGYMANLGALAALAARGDALFSDRLNHASIWDGVRLSGATVHPYRHGDMDQLEAMLKQAQERGSGKRLIVTETLFGMDGDMAPLRRLVELKIRYGAALMVDEAHAGGVFGPQGEGLAYEEGLQASIDLHMGTFGKAFGVCGAYLAGKRSWIDYLINTARTLIFTTALPPATVAAILASIDLVEQAHAERLRLKGLGERLRAGFGSLGLDPGASCSHIVPLVLGDSALALRVAAALERRGVLAGLVRPPSVPAGKARLRFSLTAAHAGPQIDLALQALGESVSQECLNSGSG